MAACEAIELYGHGDRSIDFVQRERRGMHNIWRGKGPLQSTLHALGFTEILPVIGSSVYSDMWPKGLTLGEFFCLLLQLLR